MTFPQKVKGAEGTEAVVGVEKTSIRATMMELVETGTNISIKVTSIRVIITRTKL